MPRSLIQQLKAHKHDPNFGGVSVVEKGRARDRLMQAIGETPEKPVANQIDWLALLRWNTRQFVSMPATIVATFCVLVFGGWMTSVSASGSLPGDTLYRVKLVTEQAQLRFASAEHRAILHTEFAQRRLSEASALEELNDPARLVYVESAMTAFKKELSEAENQLRLLKQEGNTTEALQTGNSIDQKIEAINTSLKDQEVSERSEEVKTVTRQATNSLVDVMVETHEYSVDPEGSHREMRLLFRDELSDLKDRERFNLGRIAVMEGILEDYEELEAVSLERLGLLERGVKDLMKPVADAESLAAAGGYRVAFDILKDVDNNMLSIERQLVEAENAIIAAMQKAEEPDADMGEPIVNVEEPADEVLNAESTSDSLISEDTD